MHKKLLFCVVVIGVLCSSQIDCRVISVNRQNRFFDRMEKSTIALVLFIDKSKDMMRCAPEEFKSMRQAEYIFNQVSCSARFAEGDLRFIKVNVALSSDLASLAFDYSINSFPTYVPFKLGAPVRRGNNLVLLKGKQTAESVSDFIKNNFTKELDENIKIRARERQLKQLYYLNSMPYFWGYPCGGWYGGCWPYGGGCGYGCRPYVGIGVGTCL